MFSSLSTQRLTVRTFQEKDLADFARYRNYSEIAKYQSWSAYNYEDALRLYKRTDYALFGTAGQWFQLAIAEKYTDTLWGDLAVHFIDDQQIEIGFTIAPAHQKKGVATEAVELLLDYTFNKLKKHRVIAQTDAKNIACSKLLEKVGFRKEAHYVQNIFFKGSWGDEYLYALLNSEFKK